MAVTCHHPVGMTRAKKMGSVTMPLSLEEQVTTKMKMKDRIEVEAEKVVHGSHFPTKNKSTPRAWLTLTQWVLSQLMR